MWVDNRKLSKTLAQISELINDDIIINDYKFNEDNKIDLFLFAYSDISVNIIAKVKGEKYHIVKGQNFIETLKKFINNEITLNNKKFNELELPERIKLMVYQPNFILIMEEESNEKVNELIKNLNKID